jgi:hypothetical protein
MLSESEFIDMSAAKRKAGSKGDGAKKKKAKTVGVVSCATSAFK